MWGWWCSYMADNIKSMSKNLRQFHTTTKIVSAYVTFSIPTQKWLASYSLKFPQLEFNILSMLSISESKGNCLMEITGEQLDAFWELFSRDYDPKKVQLIMKDPDTILINIIHDSPWIIWALIEPQVIIVYPILVQKGKINIELIAPQLKLDEIFNKPVWNGLKLKVSTLSNYCSAPQLNEHQMHILTKAVEYGLFDIPRKKSLTEATELMDKETGYKISVSALSENIRRITKKFAVSFLSCSGSIDSDLNSPI
ncbi:MAG: hypothetical protein E4G98_06120 [Promethearchaeota archaeon]|nr:MAG: hypothetical protein E4G98_06120 [Candidatus Lokiarchaeota archaeon]